MPSHGEDYLPLLESGHPHGAPKCSLGVVGSLVYSQLLRCRGANQYMGNTIQCRNSVQSLVHSFQQRHVLVHLLLPDCVSHGLGDLEELLLSGGHLGDFFSDSKCTN